MVFMMASSIVGYAALRLPGSMPNYLNPRFTQSCGNDSAFGLGESQVL